MDEENVIYILKYYSTIKKNKITLFANKSMEPELIMLSEISQPQKDKDWGFPHIWKLNLKKKCIYKHQHNHTHTHT
jgi:hypothetical protein